MQIKKSAALFAIIAGASVMFVGCEKQPTIVTNYVYTQKEGCAAKAVKPWVEKGHLPGAISILYNNGVEEIDCIGYADVEHKRPITLDDPYMQCSQTKGFCGVTIAKLIEEGRIKLDDPVSKYLPEFKTLWVQKVTKTVVEDGRTNAVEKVLTRAKNAVTIRMVLNHTGGFPFDCSAKDGAARGGGWSGGAPIRQAAVISANSPLLFEPGTGLQYSNAGIDIGAAVVEVVTGMPWDEYLKKEVLLPLGMNSTCFKPTDEQLARKIELYTTCSNAPAKWTEEATAQQRPYNDGHVFPSAGAGLWTTARDQVKFYKMLMNLGVGENGVRILKEETVKNLLAVSTQPKGMWGYSLGLHAPEVDGEDKWFGHGGAWGTECSVNWHKKQLKLWAVQLLDMHRPWNAALEEAQNEFFKENIDNTKAKEFTGRTK